MKHKPQMIIANKVNERRYLTVKQLGGPAFRKKPSILTDEVPSGLLLMLVKGGADLDNYSLTLKHLALHQMLLWRVPQREDLLYVELWRLQCEMGAAENGPVNHSCKKKGLGRAEEPSTCARGRMKNFGIKK